MRSSRSVLALSLGFVALALAGCGGVRESLGLGRTAPDEFAVVDHPPLAMPPDFTLRPPEPGAPRPQETDTSQRANDIVFGGDRVTETGGVSGNEGASEAADQSDAEKALLEQAGADKANPDIRALVNSEASQKVSVSPHLLDELLWWKKKEVSPATTVNAPAEAARIKAARDKDEPLNEGATPVIEKRKSGWLGL